MRVFCVNKIDQRIDRQHHFCYISYPDTVANGYIEYQIYDSIQGLCSYLRGVVSTGAVLKAAGVGDAEATAMSAAMVSDIHMFIYLASRID